MRRLAFRLYVELEVPDDAPDPEVVLKVSGGRLTARFSGAEVLEAEATATDTREELELAAEAAALLTTEGSSELSVVEAELARIPGRKPVKVRGCWVERVRGVDDEDGFAVYDGALPGVARTREQAAVEILKRGQRRKLGAA